MVIKKLVRIAKAAGECFSIAAGVTTVVMSVIAAFVALPVFVGFVVAAGVGLICACVGGRNELKQIAKEASHKTAKAHRRAESETEQHENFLALKDDLDEIRKSLELHHQNLAPNVGPDLHPHLAQAKNRVHRANERFIQLGSNSLFSQQPQNGQEAKSPEPSLLLLKAEPEARKMTF